MNEIVCEKSGEVLGVISSFGDYECNQSAGKCADCKRIFKKEYLAIRNSPDTWPIFYENLMCKQCYETQELMEL